MNIGVGSAVDLLRVVLLVTIPGLYVVRTDDGRPLRGRWLSLITAMVCCFVFMVWYVTLLANFQDKHIRFATAATVPLLQLVLLVAVLKFFSHVVGRSPASFVFHGSKQSGLDTLMHGYVFLILMIGGIALSESLK